ncbi:TVP38/TMEM64 family protein [Natrialbaceae archaeon GCM10025810]|uniref:TVP38/TMEM64 family protein n=1 Tax=Halovalidus salilacus TaxID=3075124 RepID=UPI00362396D5
MQSQSVPSRAIAGVVILCGILVAGVLVSPSAVFGSLETLAADPVPFGLAVAGLYLVRPLLAWPTTPLAALVGYGFGLPLGVPIALACVVLTVTPVFLAARRVVGDSEPDGADRRDRGRGRAAPFAAALERTGDRIDRYYETTGPIRGVTVSRLAPIPSDVATCAAAKGGVGYRTFAIGTVIGETPWTVAAVLVGSSAATVTTEGVGDLGLTFAVACTLAALLLLAGPAYRAVAARSSLE